MRAAYSALPGKRVRGLSLSSSPKNGSQALTPERGGRDGRALACKGHISRFLGFVATRTEIVQAVQQQGLFMLLDGSEIMAFVAILLRERALALAKRVPRGPSPPPACPRAGARGHRRLLRQAQVGCHRGWRRGGRGGLGGAAPRSNDNAPLIVWCRGAHRRPPSC